MIIQDLINRFAASCNDNPNFFGFPTWYQYLPGKQDQVLTVNGKKVVHCEIVTFQISDIPYVLLAAVDIALRVGALVAVGYIIYGGIQFIIAQGETDKAKKARQTIINALIGLVITLLSVGLVNFVGSRIG